MAITTIGFTGSVDQDDYSRLDRGSDGMVGSLPGSANLRVDRVVGQTRRVSIQTGQARAPGVRSTLDALATYDFPANASGNARLDWLVLRWSWAASPGTCVITHVQGTPAPSPLRPALTQTVGVQWDLPLALVRVDAGVGAFPADAVSDARYWDGDGVTVVPARLIDPPHHPGRELFVSGTRELLLSDGTVWTSVNPAVSSGALTVSSSWGDFGGGTGSPSYYIDGHGGVQLSGVLTRLAAGFTLNTVPVLIATVPTAARPAFLRTFPVLSKYGPIRMSINPSGSVTISLETDPVSFATGGWLSFDAATYRL